MQRILLAIVVFLISVATLLPSALSSPQHGDEAQYAWGAAYYGRLLLGRDFRSTGPDIFTDPGWNPRAYWARCCPMGTRWVLGIGLAAAGVPVPRRPYSFTDPALQGPETSLLYPTLVAGRVAALLCAGVGLALVALRLGWSGVVGALLFLAIPHVRDDLARAWAEGPLILGVGLVVVSWGSRWLSLACAVAASFKLTALAVWPAMLWPGAFGRGVGSRWFFVSPVVWSLLSPPSWFAGGPLYLLSMLRYRRAENVKQFAEYSGVAGMFLQSRYLLPFELAFCCVVACLLLRRKQLPAPRGG